MAQEVLRYIMTAPYTFMSGVTLLSELLPLPLPIQTRDVRVLYRLEPLDYKMLAYCWYSTNRSTISKKLDNLIKCCTHDITFGSLTVCCHIIQSFQRNVDYFK